MILLTVAYILVGVGFAYQMADISGDERLAAYARHYFFWPYYLGRFLARMAADKRPDHA